MRYRVAPIFLLALAACDPDPTLLVTNATGTPLKIIAYDYSVSTNTGPPGIYPDSPNPEFALGQVNSASVCLRLDATMSVADEFVLTAENLLTGVETPATGTFVPKDAPGWSITFDTLHANPLGPVPTHACMP